MKPIIGFLLMSSLLSCQVKTHSVVGENTGSSSSVNRLSWKRDLENSKLFLIDYSQFLIRENPDQSSITQWIKGHRLVTESFQNAYQALVDSAWKVDPEYGLGFDPIFDAQDFPTDEFYIIDHDSLSQTIRIGSKQWAEFSLLIKMVSVNDHYLLDKIGVVNNH